MGGAFGDRRRGQLVGVLGEKLGLCQVGGVRHAPPPLTAALLPFPSQVWAVCGRKTQSHGEPPGGTVAGLTMRGPGLQAGEEDLPGKVPGEFSSPSVCRPAWKMLRWGESRGRTSQQPVWLILPGPQGLCAVCALRLGSAPPALLTSLAPVHPSAFSIEVSSGKAHPTVGCPHHTLHVCAPHPGTRL